MINRRLYLFQPASRRWRALHVGRGRGIRPRDLITIYESEDWQGYLAFESLSPVWMTADEQRAYWAKDVESHRALLAALES